MDLKEHLEAERKELNLLIKKGVSFDVQRTIYVRQKGIFGRFKKRIKQTETLTFQIKEPTLSVLDLISSEQIELHIDEPSLQTINFLSESKKLVNAHSKRLARIVAINVLGQDYIKAIQNGLNVKYEYDEKALNDLTALFFTCLKPSKLVKLNNLINSMSNLGDFINSIRLMSASRTTMPILIEEEKEG